MGACVFSFAFGFKVSELCAGRGGQVFRGGKIWFRTSKKSLFSRCSRCLSVFLETWFRFFVLVSPLVALNLEKDWGELVGNSALPHGLFHCLKKATAHALFGFGVSVPSILLRCRW